MRLLNILVIAALILAASFVYKIKFDSTLQAERVAKLGNELRRERDATARLRAEWARLDTPERIQGLAERHLKLKAIQSTQFDTFDALPERPLPPPPATDPIATILAPSTLDTTGSIPQPKVAR
jgi:cell division protein FtsL